MRQTLFPHFNRSYSFRTRLLKSIIGSIALLVGGLIYLGYRSKELLMFDWVDSFGLSPAVEHLRLFINSDGINDWIKYSLPDGLWIFAYMCIIDSIWNGDKSIIARVFTYSLPIVAIIIEFLQLFDFVYGVYDPIDLLCYVFAILLFMIIKII